MRVAYVCADAGVPVFGRKGCSVHVQEVLRALRRRGAAVELFAANLGGESPEDLDEVRIHALPAAPKGDVAEREAAALAANDALRTALARESLRRSFDFLYERHSLWSFAAMEFAHERHLPALLEVNAPLVAEQRHNRKLIDERSARECVQRAFRGASALLAVSDELADNLAVQGVERDKLHVVANGVAPRRFDGARPMHERRHDQFTIGFVGTLKPWHGLPTLIEAFARLHARDESYRLLIVGDGPEREALAEQLAAAGPRVAAAAIFTGAAAPAEIPRWLATMDVAVAPYPDLDEFYFSPLKLFEYMAAGLPIVASRIGQIARVMEHERHGLLAPPGDPVALAAAIERLRREPALRASCAASARDKVERQHTWEAVAERILQLARSIPLAGLDRETLSLLPA